MNDSKTLEKLVVSKNGETWALFLGVVSGKGQDQRRYSSTECIGREGPRTSGIMGPVGWNNSIWEEDDAVQAQGAS